MSKRDTWMSTYVIHPAADLFPMMSEEDFQALKADIKAHGQRDCLMLWKGQLIDGRNRLRACSELGIAPDVGEIEDDVDPIEWVLSRNLHRRHLTTAQRAMVADKLATLRHGEKKADTGIQVSSQTQAEAAALLHVSVDSVQKARKVRNRASKRVVAAVETGKMSLNEAVSQTKPAERKKKSGRVANSAASIVDSLTKKHVGHIARGLTAIAKSNGGEGTQFKAADAGLNQMINALKKMRDGER